MTDDVIPLPVRKFLIKNIDCVAQLEGLLQLRADPAQAFAAEILARKLYIPPAEAGMLLDRLAEQGLLVKTDGLYSYKPASPELGQMMDQVADLYAHHLIPVTNFIHSKSRNKIRAFADAFRIRKDED